VSALFGFAVLIGIVLGLAVGIRALLKSTIGTRSVTADPDWQPPKSDPLPYARKKYFFSAAERSFYEVLRRLAPNYTLFAKVRLADVVYVTKGTGAWRSHMNQIDRKHLDFVICDANLAPVLAVELDDSSHDDGRRQERDAFVDEVLAASALPILHMRAKRGYVPDELRQLLAPYIKTI
jgi:Protein of unknown function (DUF2726)